MRPFELLQPESLAEACAFAAEGATIKAAGVDLLDRFKARIESPPRVVNLMPLGAQLSAIRAAGENGFTIGAMTTLAQLAAAPEAQGSALAALREAAGGAATPQVRNRATVGGNLLQLSRCWYLRSAEFTCAHDGKGIGCRAIEGDNRYHAVLGQTDCVRVHPSNLAPALAVLGAEVEITAGRGKTRRIPLLQLYPEMPVAARAEHTLQKGELLTAVHVPAQPPGSASAYGESREKLSFDWATTAAAVRLRLEGGKIAAAELCLGAVGPNPVPCPAAARLLVGEAPGRDLFARAAEAAYSAARPLSHNAYKVQVGKAVLVDALAAAAAAAR